jgi:hypothetical protein
MVGLERLVGGFHWVQVGSRVLLELVLWGACFTWPLRFLESVPPGAVLPNHCNGRWFLFGDVKPLVLDICWSIDRLDTWFWKPLVPALRSLGESRAGLRCWATTGAPRYPGYKTLIVGPKPFIERVVEAVAGLSCDRRVSRYDQSRDVRPESGSMTGVGMYLHYKCVQ